VFNLNKVAFGISEKRDKAMNLRLPVLDVQCAQNRKYYFNKNDISADNIVMSGLVHGTNVMIVDDEDKGKVMLEADGLITNKKNIFLTVTNADCIPIYFFDEAKEVVAIAHAGWRGMVKNISKALVEKMISNFGTKPQDISVYVGPHLQKCHFEVKDDVLSQFNEKFVIRNSGITTVDLLSMVKEQLIELGVPSQNITSSRECTYCEKEKYFSYRRDKPELVESMIAWIGMK